MEQQPRGPGRPPLTPEQREKLDRTLEIRRAQDRERVERDSEMIFRVLVDEIDERQRELKVGNTVLARLTGCKWDTIKAFHLGSEPSVTRFFMMVKALGGDVNIEWKDPDDMPLLDRRRKYRKDDTKGIN